jgi:hypothetical protein
MRYEITTGQKKSGGWWARLETDSAYSRGEGDDEWTAVVRAAQESQFLFEYSPSTSLYSMPDIPAREPR